SPSKTTIGCLPAIESLMCPFFFIPTGVKRRSWQPINKFGSAGVTHRRLLSMGPAILAARTGFSTRWSKPPVGSAGNLVGGTWRVSILTEVEELARVGWAT